MLGNTNLKQQGFINLYLRIETYLSTTTPTSWENTETFSAQGVGMYLLVNSSQHNSGWRVKSSRLMNQPYLTRL